MKKKIICCVIAITLYVSAYGQSYYVPSRSKHIDSAVYNKYLTLLRASFYQDSLVAGSDHKHNIFIAYDYLGAPIDTIIKFVYKAIAYDPIYECEGSCQMPSYTYPSMMKKYPKEWKAVCAHCDSIFAKFNKGLIDTLKKVDEDDQRYRKDTNLNAFVGDLAKKQTELDNQNFKIIQDIIHKYGYPGKRLVGTELSSVAFMVIQHTNLEIQELYLPLIQKAVDNRDLDRTYLPLLIDRIRMGKNIPQLYGTQLIWNKKKEKLDLYPVEDIENVDIRRDRMNLLPLRDYLKENNIDEIIIKKN